MIPVIHDDIKAQFGDQADFVWQHEYYDRGIVFAEGRDLTCADFVMHSMRAGKSRGRGVKLFLQALRARPLTTKERPVPSTWRETKVAEVVKKLTGDV